MNRLIYFITGLAMLCLTACGGEDEPTPPTPPTPEEPTSFEYNHTPLNDYIVSFAGETKGLTTVEVINNAIDNFTTKRNSFIGTTLPFLYSIPLYAQPVYGGWSTMRPSPGSLYLNDVHIDLVVYTDNLPKECFDSPYNSNPVLVESGKFHDGNISLTKKSGHESDPYYELYISLAIEDDVIKLREE